MKTKNALIALVVFTASLALQAQSAQTIQPQPAAVMQSPQCTPAGVGQHLHVESSKPLHRLLGRLNKAIDKASGGTLSGPTTEDVKKALPPPCPLVPVVSQVAKH